GLLDRRQFGPGTLDPNQRRRSIYFFVKRSQLVPTMVLFDAPEPLSGVEQRPTTTIAPQALLMMNNQQVRDCADALARRVGFTAAITVEDAIRAGYAMSLGRPPGRSELAESLRFIEEQQASYKAGGNGDAWHLGLTDFCQVLLGLNEFIYVD